MSNSTDKPQRDGPLQLDWQGPQYPAWLSELDRQLGSLLGTLDGKPGGWLATAAALASRAAASGEIYLDLSRDPGIAQPWPDAARWRERLAASAMVGGPGSHRPLILDGRDRLYLHRFWAYQEDLAQDLRQRAALSPRRFNELRLQRTLDRLDASVTGFGAVSPLVLGTVALCRVCVVQASPSSWADLISALLVVVLEQLGRRLNVLISSPAGQRDTLAGLLDRAANDPALSAEERLLLAARPLELEHLPRNRYRSGQGNQGLEPPLRADLVVVAGAEAADLVILANLVRALPPYTRLVLLGDIRQAPRPGRSPFAALLAGPGQSAVFRRRLGRLLGEPLAAGSESLGALQNAVITTVKPPEGTLDNGLHEAFWQAPTAAASVDGSTIPTRE